MIDSLWAKSQPYQPLYAHLLETGVCSQQLLRHGVISPVLPKLSAAFGLGDEDTLALVGYLSAAHDIGKCHPLFQNKDKNMPGHDELLREGMLHDKLPPSDVAGFRHERYSPCVLMRQLAQYIKKSAQSEMMWDAILAAISLHHQGKKGDKSDYIRADCRREKWEAAQDALHAQLLDYFRPPLDKLSQLTNADAAIYQLMGVIILSDWIASDASTDADTQREDVPIEERMLAHISARGLLMRQTKLPCVNFSSMWPTLSAGGLRGIQAATEALGRENAMLYLIEAPPGEGKSEAAMFLGACLIERFGACGFYMALPTAATGTRCSREPTTCLTRTVCSTRDCCTQRRGWWMT